VGGELLAGGIERVRQSCDWHRIVKTETAWMINAISLIGSIQTCPVDSWRDPIQT
jgi:hypothetical protein